jgi:hypothetical protein
MSPARLSRKVNRSLRGVLLCGMSSRRSVVGPSARLSLVSLKLDLILDLVDALVSDDLDGPWLG